MTKARSIWLPLRLPRLHRSVVVFPGVVFALSAFLKVLSSSKACGGADPWGMVNALLLPFELVMAWILVAEGDGPVMKRKQADRRRIVGMFGAILMVGIMAVLSFLHFFGSRLRLEAADVSACGCFGPIELPYWAHMIVLVLLFTCLLAVFVHEETVLLERENGNRGV